MKLIIAGGRDIDASPLLSGILAYLDLNTTISEVVSGGTAGVDAAGEKWQKNMFLLCGPNAPKLKVFSADWNAHGKAAGPIRNRQMAQYADGLLLIWDGKSRGSANMKLEMETLGKVVYEVVVPKQKKVL